MESDKTKDKTDSLLFPERLLFIDCRFDFIEIAGTNLAAGDAVSVCVTYTTRL